MAIEVANAYVALTVKAPGVKRDIERELGGIDGDKAGRGVGSKLMGGIKTGALIGAAAAGAAVVGTLGVALTKGFQRLNAIDQAEAKMTGLGFTAEETAGLMDNALASVRGTAFGLGDAAGVAAKLAAGGLGPGEKMADLLGTVANSAAAAGGSLDEMGSIFSKAMTQANGVQNDVIGQLADRGIPIYQALGDQLGVTAGEVFKLASEGKVSFEQFAAAAQDAAGGVAEAMGGTVQGSWDNLLASLGRVGANLLEGVFDDIAPALQGITDAMGPIEDKAKEVGKGIGGLFDLVAKGDFTSDLREAFGWQEDSPIVDFILTLRETLGDLDFAPLMELAGYLSPLGLAFKVLQPVLPQVLGAFGEIASVLGSALFQVIEAVLPLVVQIVNVFAQLLAQVLPPLLPIIVQLAEIIGAVLLAVLPLIEPLMQLVEAIFPILQGVIAGLIPIIQGVVDAIGTVMIPIVETLVDILGGVITFLTGVFSGDWEQAWQGIQDIFGGIFEGIVNIGKGVINGIIDLINGFLGGLNEVGNFVSDITGGSIDFSIGKIPHLADGATIMPRSGGTLAVLAEAGRPESVVDTGLMNRALEEGLAGRSGGAQVQVDAHFQGVEPAVAMDLMAQKLSFAVGGR